VFPGDAQAFLGVSNARGGRLAQPHKDVFEGVHASIDEKEGGVVAVYERSGRNDQMPPRSKKVQKSLTGLGRSHESKGSESQGQVV
jgi:hypothetical protein